MPGMLARVVPDGCPFQGMAYLESQRLIHRDLAARNVLVFSPKKVCSPLYRLTKASPGQNLRLRLVEVPGRGRGLLPFGVQPQSPSSHSLVCTRVYQFPQGEPLPKLNRYHLQFTTASDIWAFAVTLWEMFTYGQMPWNGMTGAEVRHLPQKGQYPFRSWTPSIVRGGSSPAPNVARKTFMKR